MKISGRNYPILSYPFPSVFIRGQIAFSKKINRNERTQQVSENMRCGFELAFHATIELPSRNNRSRRIITLEVHT